MSPAPESGNPRKQWRAGDRRAAPPPAVLLVDDEEDQRELYRQYLRYAGFRVEVASAGAEVVDRVLAMRPDVIVMDLAMPGVDGFEATRRLKALSAVEHIPVLALTAHGDLPREWAIEAGCDECLRKPCLPSALAAEIERVLRLRTRR